MGFRVLKFGGSSVADATAMSRVLDIVDGALDGGRVVLVSSAISGCTDGLLACADGNTEGEAALMERHLARKARQSGKHHLKGPAKRTEEDDRRFAESFEQLITLAEEASE